MKKNIFLAVFFLAQTVTALYAADNTENNGCFGHLPVISENVFYPMTISMGDNPPWEEAISESLDKVLENVKEGSVIAISKIKLAIYPSSDKSYFKDVIVELLLEKGYKVVEKKYLESLYEEQQAQQSGIYNQKTTVKTNNFSAVGYYIEFSIENDMSERVRLINVSTGEIEGIGSCIWGVGGFTCK